MYNKTLLTLFSIFCLLYETTYAASTVPAATELCALFKNGTKLRKPGSCSEYIICQNGVGTYASCSIDKVYDGNKQNCVAKNALSTTDDYCRNRCKSFNGKWVADPVSCRGYLYCNGGVAQQGYCEDGFYFDEKNQLCEFEDTSSCQVVQNICEIAPDKSEYRNLDDCTIYYSCSNNKATKKTCKNTYYNVETGKCEEKSQVACAGHPLPAKVCGTDKAPYSGFRSDGATCRGYFYCRDFGQVRDLEPIWSQCPVGTYYNEKTKSCTEPLEAVCTYNRCQNRDSMKVQTSSKDCRNYIVCKNNVAIEEQACYGDLFFDEKLQACVPYIVQYGCCMNQK